MSSLWILGGVALAGIALGLVLRALALRLRGRALARRGRSARPARIELEPCGPDAWYDPATALGMRDELEVLGFEDAGGFRIHGRPGVRVDLLAHPREHLFAAVYEHPQTGPWIEITAHYADGSSATFSSAEPDSPAPSPRHTTVFAPGAGAAELFARCLAECPEGALRPAVAREAADVLEEAWADAMAFPGDAPSARRRAA